MMTFWGPAMPPPPGDAFHDVNGLLLSRRLQPCLPPVKAPARGWPGPHGQAGRRPAGPLRRPAVAAAGPRAGSRSVQQAADLASGLDGFPADLVEPLRRVPRRRSPDVDHRNGIVPRVQHRGRGAGGKLLILTGAK